MLASLVAGLIVATLAAPSGSADGVELIEQRLDELISSPVFARARVGVYVEDLDEGAVVYEHNPDALLIPASNVKILTTAAALYHLGPDHRFPTEVYATPDASGVVDGALTVKGYGDPYLVPERIYHLASRIHFHGVREIKGDLVIDDTFFAGGRMPEGSEQDRSSYSYMAPAGAVSVGFNAILVQVRPGAQSGAPATVVLDPPSGYAGVAGRVRTTGGQSSRLDVWVEPRKDRSRVRVHGRIGVGSEPRAYWRRIDNPPIYAGEIIKAALARFGVAVRGKVRTGAVPADTDPLVRINSPRLAELVGIVNKHSNNFMAAQIARAIGAHVHGAPGTWEKGKAAIESFLHNEVGIDRAAFDLGNASGLHDVNKIRPRHIVRILRYMHGHPRLRPEFITSLAVAGGVGTLSDRMQETDADHILRAKTGTLSVASTLSGYVTTRAGRTLAFSLMVNDYRAPIKDVWKAQDEMGALLAGLDIAPPVPNDKPTPAVSAVLKTNPETP